ncbi:MAG: DNA/RNA non-specific endonuclease [Clostridia bacterium]|nr:DNA/RNA non-specific endonuclease [Clostridia bacterium]
MNKRLTAALLSLLLICSLLLSACGGDLVSPSQPDNQNGNVIASVKDVPKFDGKTPFVAINGNQPVFTEQQLKTKSYEKYERLDYLGRCTVAIAVVGTDIMPTEDRGSIGSVKPTGWHTVKYDIVDGKYLYNRCHLIGFQLTGENANERNLITGTRYLNIEGMLPFENMIADYVKETDNHVLYRVTPYFEDKNLLASGVQLEAYSVEDNGEGICFNVYAYNAQPGVIIDYRTGESRLEKADNVSSDTEKREYVVNISSGKFHLPDCSGVKSIKPQNKKTVKTLRSNLISNGYQPCKQCNP